MLINEVVCRHLQKKANEQKEEYRKLKWQLEMQKVELARLQKIKAAKSPSYTDKSLYD